MGDIQWIFNKTSGIGDIQMLKKNVLESLRKADGKPIEELDKLFKNADIVNKFKAIFKDNRIAKPQDLIKKLEDDKIFNQIFEIIE